VRALEWIHREIARSLREIPEDRVRLLQVATVVDLEDRGRTRRVFSAKSSVSVSPPKMSTDTRS
jgi:hypothetical protein